MSAQQKLFKLLETPVAELQMHQEAEIDRLLEIIRKIDKMNVCVTLEKKYHRLCIEMLHPNDEFTPLLGFVYGKTVGEMLHSLNDFKINPISLAKPELLVDFAKYLALNGTEIDCTLKECPVCYEWTNLELPCTHIVCPKCAYQVTKCPICRTII